MDLASQLVGDVDFEQEFQAALMRTKGPQKPRTQASTRKAPKHDDSMDSTSRIAAKGGSNLAEAASTTAAAVLALADATAGTRPEARHGSSGAEQPPENGTGEA